MLHLLYWCGILCFAQTFRPVEDISDLLARVASNDLQVDLLESKQNDEIGRISNSIDNVILGFSGILTSIKFTGEQIGEAGKIFNKSAGVLTKSVDSQSVASHEIVQGLDEMNVSLDLISV